VAAAHIAHVQHTGSVLWLGIRLVLTLVGLGSVALLWALLSLRPRQPSARCWLAVAGPVAFCIQTAVLDLFGWTAFSPAERVCPITNYRRRLRTDRAA
jgi:hypothetical protein